ncbi:MAG: hypothetical protein ACPGO3_09925 [Magnetospiraceae bacterium]
MTSPIEDTAFRALGADFIGFTRSVQDGAEQAVYAVKEMSAALPGVRHDTDVLLNAIKNSDAFMEITKEAAGATKETRAFGLAVDDAAKKMDRATKANEKLNKSMGQLGDAAQQAALPMGKLFDRAVNGFESLIFEGGTFNDLLTDLSRTAFQMFKQAAFPQGVGAAFAGGGGGLGGGLLGALFGGGFNLDFSGLGSLFPFASGGVMTPKGPMALESYASGGIAKSPQIAMFGEGDRPEAFVPLPDGRQIPVALQGGGQAMTITQNFNISTPDAGSFRRSENQIMKRARRAVNAAGRIG